MRRWLCGEDTGCAKNVCVVSIQGVCWWEVE